jgi:hypothetical protein
MKVISDWKDVPPRQKMVEGRAWFQRPIQSVPALYEGVSKIFRTGAAIYTAVVVARSTDRWYNYHVY